MSRQNGARRMQLSMMDFTNNKRHNPANSRNEAPEMKRRILDSKTTDGGVWESIGGSLLVYTANGVESRSKVAGFDMDGTLIKTKSGAVFPKDAHDWQLWSPKIVPTLQKLYEDGYKIVIFTNQRGIEKGKVRIPEFKNKIVNVIKALKVPVQAFVSTGPVNYRKPYIGMWTELESKFNNGVKIEKEMSVYCGDAAGRLKTGTKKADHSCADRSFALNIGVPFKTPEQMFLNDEAEEAFRQPSFIPSIHLSLKTERFIPSDTKFPYDINGKEMIIMIGAPASGKSYVSQDLANKYGYSIINQDTLVTKNACQKMAQKLMDEGKNIIIDNTNRDPKTRESYIMAAKGRKYRCRAIIMDCEIGMAQHNNTFREIIGTDAKHVGINTMVLRMFYSAYREPTLNEGFDDIIRCNFVPQFESEETEKIYYYTLNE